MVDTAAAHTNLVAVMMKVVFAALHLLLRLPFAAAAFTPGSSLVLQPHSRNCCGPALFVTDAAVGSETEESRDPTTTDGTSLPRVHSLGLLRGVDTTVDNFYADNRF